MKWKLYSWGANSYGQLGQGNCDDQMLPKEVAFDSRIDLSTVSHITGGGGHVLLLTKNGELYTCGWNSKGQLGLDSAETQVSKLRIVKTQPQLKFVQVAGGWDFSIAVVEGGQLYSWGSNTFGQLGIGADNKFSSVPTLVPAFNEVKIVDAAAGLRHGLALTADGEVWSWGSGRQGQLGLENADGVMITKSFVPQKVTLPDSSKVKSIACGSDHSSALTFEGRLFIWGRNNKGQLAQNPEHIALSASPQLVGIGNSKFVELKSGWTHFIGLLDSGKLYSWGRCDYGQLGRSCNHNDPYCYKPSAVGTLSAESIETFAVGSEHNLIISDHKVWAWGWNEHGICGTGHEENVHSPKMLKALSSENTVLIGAGCGISYAVTVYDDS